MAYKFDKEMNKALLAAGASITQGFSDHYPYYFDTIGGFLLIHANEDWVACRFDDVKKAKENIRFGSLNPFSGKWNWHFHKVGKTEVDFVIAQIKKILVPEDQRRIRCAHCINGEEMCFDDTVDGGYYKGACRSCGGSGVAAS